MTLRKVIRGIVADAHLAEDVLQEVFLVAYRKLPSFRGESHLGGWLYRIAVRHAQRTRSRWKKWVLLPTMWEKAHVDNRVEASDELRAALEILGRLPVKQRAALVMHVVDEKSYEEIARVLECSIGNVGSLIHRARKVLLKESSTSLEDGAERLFGMRQKRAEK